MTFAKWTLSAAALCALVALSAPAFAQTQSAAGDMGGGGSNNPLGGLNIGTGAGAVDEGTLQKRREIEEAYKSATKNQPAAQTTAVNDPWANMRGPGEQKPAAPVAPKTAQKKKPAQ